MYVRKRKRRHIWLFSYCFYRHIWRIFSDMNGHKEIALKIVRQLDTQRRELRMTKHALSQRTGLGSRTVQRVLSGRDTGKTTLETILLIAAALEVRLEPKTGSAYRARRKEAMRKASKLAAMVQGTSALEAQAISDGALREIRHEIADKLVSGSGRELWG
jgi:transcriptional regulator with XRE-family HTH domain